MNQNDVLKKFGIREYASDLIRLQANVSENQAFQIRDRFASMFGNGLLYLAESRFHNDGNTVDLPIYVIESAFSLNTFTDKNVKEIRSIVDSIKNLTGISSVLLQVNSWTLPL